MHVGEIVSLLERPVYSHREVDRLLGLNPDTAKRWINGYRRYPLAYSRPFLEVEDRQVLARVQEETGLDSQVWMVVDTGQYALSPRINRFFHATTYGPDPDATDAEHGWVAITNDHPMRTRYYEASLALEHGLMVVNIKGVGRRTAWDQLVRLTKHWQSVERFIAKSPAGPWWL